jgi:hypothetical protein
VRWAQAATEPAARDTGQRRILPLGARQDDQRRPAQVFFNDHFTNEEAFPSLAPGNVRLSLKAGGVLDDCRFILTEAGASHAK